MNGSLQLSAMQQKTHLCGGERKIEERNVYQLNIFAPAYPIEGLPKLKRPFTFIFYLEVRTGQRRTAPDRLTSDRLHPMDRPRAVFNSQQSE
jgi:hypothetical protein